MELRISYSRNIAGQEELATQVEDLSRKLGHFCLILPMTAEGEGDYPTMEMHINGVYALGSDFEIRDALSDGTIKAFLESTGE
jgi:hypothetical protein